MPIDSLKHPPILVVEDNQETQLLLRHHLKSEYAVEVVNNAASAFQRAQEKEYHLIIMDINLGDDEDGLELHRKVREVDHCAETPIIALTAYALPGDRERFVQAGFDDYLSKPFTRSELLTTINQALSTGKK